AALITPIEVDGLAIKNCPILIERPASDPLVQDGPVEFRRSEGTSTRYRPPESTYRNGVSFDTGLVASVVYGCPPDVPKLCAGAPLSPAKTWFHTPFDQPSRFEFRTMNCCCDPLMTVLPVNA